MGIPFVEREDDNDDDAGSADSQQQESQQETTSTQSETAPRDEQLVAQFEAIDERLSAIENDLDTVNDRAESIENENEVIEDRIDSVETEIEEHEEYIQELLGIYDAVAAKVNPLFGDDLRTLIPSLSTEAEGAADTYDLKEVEEVEYEPQRRTEPQDVETTEDDEDDEFALDEGVEDFDASDDNEDEVDDDESYEVETIRGGLSDEVVALHWLDNLVAEVGYRGTIRTLDYYTRIGWVSPRAKHDLIRRLRLYKLADDESPNEDEPNIPSEVHELSQDYISRITA